MIIRILLIDSSKFENEGTVDILADIVEKGTRRAEFEILPAFHGEKRFRMEEKWKKQ